MLAHILGLVPTLSSVLQPLLVRNFPHKRQSQIAQVTFIRNLLRVTEYCPEMSEKILSTIIERAIQIDVCTKGGLHQIVADSWVHTG
jgi:RNA polymerase I-specific transcription initiation factor RRN3